MTLSKIIKHVMSSASEAETAAIFYNRKAALPPKISLEEMGHEQQKTPVITDNTTVCGLLALHSDASYLSEPEYKSRAAGHFFLGKQK